MNALLVAGAALAGAAIGLGSGRVATLFERSEKLEEEEKTSA